VKRGEFYLVRKPGTRDPRKQRVFIVVSRQALIESRFTSVICSPVYSQHDELSTQVRVGPDEGLKKDSSIHCDELVSLPKSLLTNYVGSLKGTRLIELDRSLAIALGLGNSGLPW
jgi:mRNA interferase MazF